MKLIRSLQTAIQLLREIPTRLDNLQLAVGRIELALQIQAASADLQQNEFKVYSQWGEDGIIQYLIRQVHIPDPIFVEFGVGNYREANTRFLMQNNNWSGLVIDSSAEHINAVKRDPVDRRYNLKAERALISTSNINDLLASNGIFRDIGLLSIDIDGNDYWIWDAITSIRPAIVICEYQSLFGKYSKVTIPYSATFNRYQAHFSGQYFGASIGALAHLANKKGYVLIGSNSAGCNAFFVREDMADNLRTLQASEAFTQSAYRDSRDRDGRLTYLSMSECLRLIGHLPLIDVESQAQMTVQEAVAQETCSER